MKLKKAVTLSSNTLFHFTKNLDNLKGILKDEFYPHYSLEPISLDGTNHSKIAFPMVSFCDIPLSQIKNHISMYGTYGIGLSKIWGSKRGLNPVLYIRQGSKLSISLHKTIMNLSEFLRTSDGQQLKGNNKFRESVEAFWHIAKYLKQYEGSFSRGKKKYNNVRFYDEKEWRHIPDIKKSYLSKQDFNNPTLINKANEELKRSKLSFKPHDIKYIIVNNEKEISKMVTEIKTIYPSDIVEKLTTKLLTIKQITDDF